MTTQKLIEGQKAELERLFQFPVAVEQDGVKIIDFDYHREERKRLQDWHKQSLAKIFEAEIERLKAERKIELDKLEMSADNLDRHYHKGKIHFIDDQITHLQSLLALLK